MDKNFFFNSIIFGANGQDGYLMARFLLKKKKKILAITRKKDKYLFNLQKNNKYFLKNVILKNYTKNNYLKLLKKFKFENVFFFAGYSKIPVSKKEVNICKNSNFTIFKDLLESCIKAKIQPRILYTTSGEIFGSNQITKKNEKSKLLSNNHYSEAKINTTNLINSFRKRNKLFIVNAICYNHESIFTPKNHLLRKIIKKLSVQQNQPVKIYNPNEKRNISHTYDFLPLFEKSLKTKKSNNYIFANSKNISVREITKLINKKYNKKVIFINDEKKSTSRMADNFTIKNKFNYSPIFTNEKIISRMISYHKNKIFIK